MIGVNKFIEELRKNIENIESDKVESFGGYFGRNDEGKWESGHTVHCVRDDGSRYEFSIKEE